MNDPNKFYGQTVTVSGEVSQSLTPQAFEMGGKNNDRRRDRTNAVVTDNPSKDADGLLVIANLDKISSPPKISAGETVRVTGRVREFDLREVEKELGTNLRGGMLIYYRSQPSLIATSIESAGGWTTR